MDTTSLGAIARSRRGAEWGSLVEAVCDTCGEALGSYIATDFPWGVVRLCDRRERKGPRTGAGLFFSMDELGREYVEKRCGCGEPTTWVGGLRGSDDPLAGLPVSTRDGMPVLAL